MAKRITVRPRVMLYFTLLVFILIVSILENVNLLFTTVMVIWALMFSYSIINLKNSPLLFCFMVSFFVFLIGRQFCFHYLHIEQVYEFLDEVNNYTYICLIVSFIGIIVGFLIPSRELVHTLLASNYAITIADLGTNKGSYQVATEILFYICMIGGLSATIMQIRYVSYQGYLESYSAEIGTVGIPSIFSYPARFLPIAISLYLATKPEKKRAMLPMILYEGYAILRLFTGQRYPFVGISMLMLIYYVMRSKKESNWIKKYHYLLLLLAIPVLMMFMTAYDSIRVGKEVSTDGFFDSIINFLVQQGGSINVIRRTIYNADQLSDMRFVSFQSIYSAIFENGISRRLFNIKTYDGNSIERALTSNNLAHRLSFIAYGDGYLAGKGTGSSYIAELLHDFGLLGVFVGSVLYGCLLKGIDKIEFKHSFSDGIKLAMIYYIILAPRGGFDSFIGNVFNLQSVIGLVVIWLLTQGFSVYGLIRNKMLRLRT